jgi:PAS domain S-box-containing protein
MMDGPPGSLLTLSALVEAALRNAAITRSEQANSERLALAGADLGMWDFRLADGSSAINARWASMVGYEVSELNLVHEAWLQLVHPDDVGAVKAAMDGQFEGDARHYEIEFRMRHRDGHWVWIESRGRVVERDAKGTPLRMAGTHMDITDRKLAQEELRRTSDLLAQQREALQITLDSIAQGISTMQADGHTTIYNRRYLELLDLPEDLLAAHPTHQELVKFQTQRGDFGEGFGLVDPVGRAYVAGGGGDVNSPGTYLRRSRKGQILEVKTRILPGGGMVRTFTDMTQYYETQQALMESEARFRSLTALSSDWYWEQDAQFRFVQFVGEANAFRATRERWEGKTRWELPYLNLTEADWDAHRAILYAHKEFRDLEIARLIDDGTVGWMSISGEPVHDARGVFTGYRGIGRNITERKRAENLRESLETQLRESQKMQAIGTLAGGVAHDFNNMLGTILGNAELARQDATGHPLVLQSLAEIEKAGRKGRDLVRQILSFSRRQPTARRVLPMLPVIQESVRLLRSTMPVQVRIEVTPEAETALVLADETQLEQVLVNLGTNAAYALRGVSGQQEPIVVRMDLLDRAEVPALIAVGAPAGLAGQDWLRVTVQDRGAGMDALTRSRMFEPFFTTKSDGEGTGLGLSVVHGIMQTHEGLIGVHSEPGLGSTIELFFPRRLETSGSATPAPVALATGQGTGQRVLYVDDEESLVFLVTRMLKRRGFEVSGHTDQQEGLAALRADPHAIDLAVVDYNMPGMSGLDVAREIRLIRPDLPVAIASGFITDELREAAAAMGIHDLIFKPNAVEEFCDVVLRLVPKVKG